ncbi:MAG TPA: BlaI/MecI/CopY family transcriptional regulator [Rhodothermales bacterium]|nr:BlaI/MecI/CopY family transcriptional regulator [Rhodothermales bacterium]HRR08762.1 BlaI/MecI/CopY family transcriptional regulator [Rhodothermales bacterium]
MKRRILQSLGEAEWEILQAIWQLGEATVSQVHEHIRSQRDVAYTTIMTLMKRLSEKGYLSYTVRGQAYVYHANMEPDAFKNAMVSEVVEKIFNGSSLALAQTLFKQETFSEADRAEIESLLVQIRKTE